MYNGVITIEYLAGLFDGEGCISIIKSNPFYKTSTSKTYKYFLSLMVGMTDPRPIVAFKEFFNGRRTVIQEQPNSVRQRTMYRYQATSNVAEEIIKKLLPYLICKKEQAILALEFRDYIRESSCLGKVGFARKPVPKEILKKRHNFYLKMKELKVLKYPH